MKRKLSVDEIENSSSDPDSGLDFNPIHFLRCHSKIKTDGSDVSTQIWQCSFEPDPLNPAKTTDVVATCGGNSVCFIDVSEGKVLRKYYSSDKSEIFFALSWTTCESYNSGNNLLAVGGRLCTIHLIHPIKNAMFLEYKVLKKLRKDDHISSLLFHRRESNTLFCSMNSRQIFVFDIGNPLLTKCKNPITLLNTLSSSSDELFTITLSTDLNILLAASDDYLRGWKIKDKTQTSKTPELKFTFPGSIVATKSRTTLVDSVEALDGSIVATKCVLHGLIYIWDMKRTLLSGKTSKSSFAVTPFQTLKWSNTDNYYMGMGFDLESGLLGCGDDKGAIWVYNLELENRSLDDIQPDAVLEWPEVKDFHIAHKRKLNLDTYDIVVDKVAVGSQGHYLVAVTANNMVCIWKRV